jgi:hypothetical protein
MKKRQPNRHYVISVSLGTGIEPTAIAITEQEMTRASGFRAETKALRLRHLERLPANESLPVTVQRIVTLLASPDIEEAENCGGAEVVLDVTGSGRAIVELFQRESIKPVVVNVTGSSEAAVEVEHKAWRLPKAELVGHLRIAYEADRLRMAKGLELVPKLLDELNAFKMRAPRLDLNDPESWRDTEQSDLVLAVAVGTWWTGHNRPRPDAYHKAQTRKIEAYYAEQARGIL